MPNSLQELYLKIESLKGKKLILFLIPLFLSGILMGIIVGNFMPQLLKTDEDLPEVDIGDVVIKQGSQFEGKVVYVDPRLYPSDNISYVLEDASGNDVILLKANDQKLAVTEGLTVVIFGDVEKTKDGKEDVLNVDRILVKNK